MLSRPARLGCTLTGRACGNFLQSQLVSRAVVLGGQCGLEHNVRSFATSAARRKAEALPPIVRTPLLKNDARTYDEAYNNFKWDIPEDFNIAHAVCDKHFPKYQFHECIVIEEGAKKPKIYTYGDIYKLSNMLANCLAVKGVRAGDRIGVFLGQCAEVPITHVTAWKSGCISVPLFSLFGPEAIEYRLKAAGVKAVVTDLAGMEKIQQVRANLPDLKVVVVTGKQLPDLPEGCVGYHDLLWRHARLEWDLHPTKSSDPAMIIFTSGTTGNPKGCVHAHRVLLGHLPGVEFPHNLFPQPNEQSYSFYTPADWSWIGGLLDVLLPAMYHGAPVLAYKYADGKFDPKKMQEICRLHKVKHAFIPPTALKMMRKIPDIPKMPLKSIASGGESLGDSMFEWGKDMFGQTINEFYGQTEANLLVGNCSRIMRIFPGSMGKAIPGHVIDIVNDKGEVVKAGEIGNIAVKTPDPVAFLYYWKDEKATKEKFKGEWLLTGDLGRKDASGYFWFVGRNDDLINSSGYRIGPTEVENCLAKHKAVAQAAVIGVPDVTRGELVKAIIVLNEGVEGTEELTKEIQDFVKQRLAAHEYPRVVEYVKELPLTATGKVMHRELREREKAKNKK